MPRTDIHSPKNLVTEDYEFVACGYFGSAGEPGYSPLAHEARYLIDEGYQFAENHSAGGCYHCGAHLNYYAILIHLPTRTLVRVGETCLANRFERASADFHRLRQQAQLDRQAHRIKRLRTAWFAVDPDREVAFNWASERVEDGHYGWEGLRHKFVHQVNRYGSVSDRFVRAMMRDMVRTERREEQRAAERALGKPVIEGRIVITGEVLTIRSQENDFGSALKMLVRDDRGFKVWGSVPRALLDIPVMAPLDREALEYQVKLNRERHAEAISGSYWKDLADRDQKLLDEDDGKPVETGRRGIQRGERVTFTASVQKSQDDETFGFFSRPSKAALAE